MAEPLRLATYNVEWFNNLFDDQGRMLADGEPSARYRISRADQLGALGIVFTALDADGIMVIEAPDTNGRRSTVTALEGFARQIGLRARRALIGFPSETEQEIAFLYDPDRLTPQHDPQGEPTGKKGSEFAPRFDSSFRYFLGQDGPLETIRFSTPPPDLAAPTAEGRRFRMVGVHAKSKNPYGFSGREEFLRISIENRRKQLAQCLWLRQRVDAHLAAGDDLIVMGDFNDGPGLDRFERLFGHSGIEVVLGVDGAPDRQLHDPNAVLGFGPRMAAGPTSARFWHAPQKCYFEALLDFIMVSPRLAALDPPPVWRIWHPNNDPRIAAVPELREALLTASDHFPVSLDIAL